MGAKVERPVAIQLAKRRLLHSGARNHGLRGTIPVALLAATIYPDGQVESLLFQ